MKLMIEIHLSEIGAGQGTQERDDAVARILHGLADQIGNPDFGVEGVNCTGFDLNGKADGPFTPTVGEVYLSDQDETGRC